MSGLLLVFHRSMHDGLSAAPSLYVIIYVILFLWQHILHQSGFIRSQNVLRVAYAHKCMRTYHVHTGGM